MPALFYVVFTDGGWKTQSCFLTWTHSRAMCRDPPSQHRPLDKVCCLGNRDKSAYQHLVGQPIFVKVLMLLPKRLKQPNT